MREIDQIKIEPHLTSAVLHITGRCDWACSHCCKPTSSQEISLGDLNIVQRETTTDPLFNRIIVSGGEPRLHPQFSQVMGAISQSLRGSLEPRPDPKPQSWLAQKLSGLKMRIEDLSISPQEEASMRLTGEWEAFLSRISLNAGVPEPFEKEVEVYTNGHGIESPEDLAEIAYQWWELGVNHMTVSADIPHQEFAFANEIQIDYDSITKASYDPQFKRKIGIPKNLAINLAGVGNYVIPVGRARNFTWGERVGKTDHFDQVPTQIRLIKEALNHEFLLWPQISDGQHTHCYCGPKKFHDDRQAALGFPPEWRIHNWEALITPDLEVSACALGIIPPVANLHNSPIREVYDSMQNQLYGKLASIGPHGILNELTGISGPALREEFLYRTPCGICEDLVADHLPEMQAMVQTPLQG